MNDEDRTNNPLVILRCRYCGYTFGSDEYETISDDMVQDECPLCSCPCYPVEM